MSERTMINDEVLDLISGGSITYTPSSKGAMSGTVGINGNKIYQYSDEQAMIDWISAHYQDKNWSSFAEQDQYIIDGLLDAKLIKLAQ